MSIETEWSLRSLEELAHRLSQQLTSYEALYAAETRRMEAQLQTQQQIQQDELRMLREELTQLEGGIAALRASHDQRYGAPGDPAGTEPKEP